MKKIAKAFFMVGLLILWLFFSIGVGVLFLAAKESMGWNVFTYTGFHAVSHCLQQEISRAVGKP
jgi:hypothetical protein